MNAIKTSIAAISTMLVCSGALAAPEQDVSVTVQVLHEVEITDATGNKILEREPLEVAMPEQTVIYKISVKNSEVDTVNNVVLHIPISESLLIKPATFTADLDIDVSFSVDGNTFEPIDQLTSANSEDTDRATAEDITAIRIDIPEVPKNDIFYIEYDAVVR